MHLCVASTLAPYWLVCTTLMLIYVLPPCVCMKCGPVGPSVPVSHAKADRRQVVKIMLMHCYTFGAMHVVLMWYAPFNHRELHYAQPH